MVDGTLAVPSDGGGVLLHAHGVHTLIIDSDGNTNNIGFNG